MTPAQEQDRATKAKAILDSPIYQESMESVKASIIKQIETAQIGDVDTISDLHKCLKLLNSLRVTLERTLATGKVAELRLAQEIKRQENPYRDFYR